MHYLLLNILIVPCGIVYRPKIKESYEQLKRNGVIACCKQNICNKNYKYFEATLLIFKKTILNLHSGKEQNLFSVKNISGNFVLE